MYGISTQRISCIAVAVLFNLMVPPTWAAEADDPDRLCAFGRCRPSTPEVGQQPPAPAPSPAPAAPLQPSARPAAASVPSISAYKDNFFDLGLKSWGENRPAGWMFRMGVKSPLWVSPVSGNGLYFTYRMTGYWDIQAESAPFRDINHNPALLWLHLAPSASAENAFYRGFEAGLEHISNGQDNTSTGPGDTGNMRSRSIDYAGFFEPRFQWQWLGREWRYQPRLWLPVGTSENPGIRGEWGLLWNSLNVADHVEVSVKGNPFNKGQAAIKLFLDPDEWAGNGRSTVRPSITVFNGYGDGLLEYDKRRTWVRVGVSFSAFADRLGSK